MDILSICKHGQIGKKVNAQDGYQVSLDDMTRSILYAERTSIKELDPQGRYLESDEMMRSRCDDVKPLPVPW